MIPLFKIHASAIGQIIGGAVGKPTAKQLALLTELENKEKRTEKQTETLNALIAKRDAKPCLQEGAKTYCKKWLLQQSDLYDRRKQFKSKYTDKGNFCEPEGIKLTAKIMGYGEVFKNEVMFENDWIIGTPDLILKVIIEDIKCSWNEQTFPLFEKVLPESDYWWQGQGYMDIVGKDKFAVNYCLIDTPTPLIDRAAKYRSMDYGFETDVPAEIWDEVCAEMTYPNTPDYLRFRRFPFDKDETAIQAIHTQVELCREYIQKELLPQLEILKSEFDQLSQLTITQNT